MQIKYCSDVYPDVANASVRRKRNKYLSFDNVIADQ